MGHRRRHAVAVSAVAASLAVSLTVGACASGGTITRTGPATTTATGRPGTTTTTRPATGDGQPGSADLADAITPGAGNGGYDVVDYDVDIDVAADRASIEASVTISATATQALSRFNLDLADLTVDGIVVDGRPAQWLHEDDELSITPSAAIADGAEFTTTIAYHGQPQPVPDPSAPGEIGWLEAPTGTYVAAEPTGAKGFLPCNDHPSDKATFTFALTASDEDTVVANGVLESKEPGDDEGTTTWTYSQDDPMATYLVQIAVGAYDVVESTGPHGIVRRDVVLRRLTEEQRAPLTATNTQIEFFEPLFGPFPFDSYGVLVADADPNFALETQTLTLLPAEWLENDFGQVDAVLAHELAHQWFGDAVTPARWIDIWLNEGFATYAEWLWMDHSGELSLDRSVDDALSQAVQWRRGFGAVTDFAPEYLFSPNQYGGAGIVLHALRLTIGDDTFFALLRRWVADHSGGSVTTEEFEALASEMSGQDLTAFFDQWLRSEDVPELPG